MPKLLTREQAREALNNKGMTIAEWSRIHGFNRKMVTALLSGRKKGLYGEPHRAAVLLGIKEGEIVDRPREPRPKKPH